MSRRGAAAAHPPLGGEGWADSPQRMFHIPTWQGLRTLLHELEMPFARLMIVWFVALLAITAVLAMLPLALIRVLGVSTRLPDLRLGRRCQSGDVSAGSEDIKMARRAACAAGRFRRARRGHRSSGCRLPV